MEYNVNQTYPKSELDNIYEWWQTHKDTDINVSVDTVTIVPRSQEQIHQDRIFELQNLLQSTDYVASKLSEASAIAELTGDKTLLAEAYNKYAQTITNRRAWREELDSLLK